MPALGGLRARVVARAGRQPGDTLAPPLPPPSPPTAGSHSRAGHVPTAHAAGWGCVGRRRRGASLAGAPTLLQKVSGGGGAAAAAPRPAAAQRRRACSTTCSPGGVAPMQAWKPPRTHHDSVTGRCVLKMDHFCVWVGRGALALLGAHARSLGPCPWGCHVMACALLGGGGRGGGCPTASHPDFGSFSYVRPSQLGAQLRGPPELQALSAVCGVRIRGLHSEVRARAASAPRAPHAGACLGPTNSPARSPPTQTPPLLAHGAALPCSSRPASLFLLSRNRRWGA